MWWWSRISTISAWSIPGALWDSSAWSTSTTLRGAGETSAERADEPQRPPPRVDDDRRAVLDVEDLRRHVLEHVVGLDGQRLRIHDPPDRDRQLDHARAHVGVQRRDDQVDARRAGRLEHVVRGPRAVGEHEQVDAELDRRQLGGRQVAGDRDVALADDLLSACGVHREHPQPAGHVAVAGHEDLAVEDVADGLSCTGRAREVRGVARLADVAAGQRALARAPRRARPRRRAPATTSRPCPAIASPAPRIGSSVVRGHLARAPSRRARAASRAAAARAPPPRRARAPTPSAR